LDREIEELEAQLNLKQGLATNHRPYHLEIERVKADLEAVLRRSDEKEAEYQISLASCKKQHAALQEEYRNEREMYLQNVDDLTKKLEKSELLVLLFITNL